MPLTKTNTGSGPLTRRTFIEQFGLVGGSTLAMTAMRSWDLMAQAGPRPVLSGRPNGTRVVVLGAGVSGLTVGYELTKLGYDVKILEARDRVGGVNWTLRRGSTHTEVGAGGETQVCNFADDQYHNGGPWRLPHWHTGVLGYCKELGVPLEVFINEGEASYFYYEGDNVGPLANKRVRLREVKADMIGYTCELMAKVVDQGALDMPLSAEDKERFVTFLVTEGYLDSADRAYKKTTARGPGDPHDFRVLLQSGLRQSDSGRSSKGRGRRRCSSQSAAWIKFPKAFQRQLGDKITLRRRDRLDSPERQRREGGLSERQDRCSNGNCRRLLRLVPAADDPQQSRRQPGARDDGGGEGDAVQPEREDGAADEAPLLGGGRPHLRRPPLFEPADRQLLRIRRGATSATRACCSASTAAARLAGLVDKPVAARIEHVLTHASKVHPQIRAEFETAYCTFWEKTPYSLGAFAGGGGGGAARSAGDARQARQPDLHRLRGRQRQRRLAGRRCRGGVEAGEAAARACDDRRSEPAS